MGPVHSRLNCPAIALLLSFWKAQTKALSQPRSSSCCLPRPISSLGIGWFSMSYPTPIPYSDTNTPIGTTTSSLGRERLVRALRRRFGTPQGACRTRVFDRFGFCFGGVYRTRHPCWQQPCDGGSRGWFCYCSTLALPRPRVADAHPYRRNRNIRFACCHCPSVVPGHGAGHGSQGSPPKKPST
jgi:hypothetical protein